MIFDFNLKPSQVSYKDRAEMAATHMLHVPERFFTLIAQIVKLAFCALFTACTFGKSEFISAELNLAGKRVLTNAAGLGTSLLGILAPINALKWQTELIEKLFDQNDLNNKVKMIPVMLTI